MNTPKIIQISVLSLVFLAAFFLLSFLQKEESIADQASDAVDISSIQIDDDYFAGKTIEWVIPFKEGGGSDTWARFNAQFLSKYIPGNPTVVISNIPGGGSIKGSNLFADRVKPDGMMILGTSGSTQLPYLLDDPRVRYDYAKYKPIWTYPTGGVVYVSPDLGIKDATEIAKIKDVPLIYASQGPTSLDLVPNLSFELLGLNVKTVFGFRGRGAGRLAFERGEVKIDYQTSSAYLKNVVPLVEAGDAVPLWSWGILDDNGELARDPSFPDLPHFGEVYEIMHGKKGEGIEYDSWFATMAAGFGGMKLVLVPKETPDKIVEMLQLAISEMKKDPEYNEKKQKAIGLYEQVIGEKAIKIFDLATNIDKAEKEWCKQFLRDKYDLNI
ncbi:MAG: tripartite tricarboxylate transporter substrate-binding protein [Bacteroidota bacterium]